MVIFRLKKTIVNNRDTEHGILPAGGQKPLFPDTRPHRDGERNGRDRAAPEQTRLLRSRTADAQPRQIHIMPQKDILERNL